MVESKNSNNQNRNNNNKNDNHNILDSDKKSLLSQLKFRPQKQLNGVKVKIMQRMRHC